MSSLEATVPLLLKDKREETGNTSTIYHLPDDKQSPTAQDTSAVQSKPATPDMVKTKNPVVKATEPIRKHSSSETITVLVE